MTPAVLIAALFFIAAVLLLVVALCVAAAEGDRQLERIDAQGRERIGWRPNGSELLNANKRAGGSTPRPTTKRWRDELRRRPIRNRDWGQW